MKYSLIINKDFLSLLAFYPKTKLFCGHDISSKASSISTWLLPYHMESVATLRLQHMRSCSAVGVVHVSEIFSLLVPMSLEHIVWSVAEESEKQKKKRLILTSAAIFKQYSCNRISVTVV